MSLFKGENDTTKNSDNMLTMSQKNIPAVRFSSMWMFTSSSFLPLSFAAHFCYISIFISQKFQHFFLVYIASFQWKYVHHISYSCASTLISRFVCQSIFAIATSSCEGYFFHFACTCVDHNVCLIIAPK